MNSASGSSLAQAGQAVHWYDFTQTDVHVPAPFAGYLAAVFVIAVLAHRHRRTASFESEYFVLTFLVEPVFLQPLVIHYGGAVTAALFAGHLSRTVNIQ